MRDQSRLDLTLPRGNVRGGKDVGGREPLALLNHDRKIADHAGWQSDDVKGHRAIEAVGAIDQQAKLPSGTAEQLGTDRRGARHKPWRSRAQAEAYLAGPIVAAAGLRFVLEPPTQELVVAADRRRVVQVILNLVANAAKYNRSGKQVRLGCLRQGGQVRVEVEDDGEGIDPADVSRLFTPFDRLGQQNRTRVEGTGLGLALSKRLVESMGGEIGFEAPEKGARFWFSLPAIDPQASIALPDDTTGVAQS
jgi:signal transduction histidine kinase